LENGKGAVRQRGAGLAAQLRDFVAGQASRLNALAAEAANVANDYL
jgi:hypothetical protein